jgi:hypothetical protein
VLARVKFGSIIAFAPLAFAALVGAACHSSTTTTPTGPSPVKCQVALTLNSGTMAAAGGSGTVAVATQAECGWTASSDVAWITNLSPAAGQGSAELRFQTAANLATTSRSGQILLNGVTVRVTQTGAQCQFDVTPRSQAFAAAGGTATVAVGASAGCAWTAASSDPWLTITAGGSGNGDGSVQLAVGANAGAARIAALSIGDQAFVVTQQAPSAPSCAYAIAPTSMSMAPAGGTTTVAITAAAGCSWTAASNASWLAVVGVGVGTGNGSVTVSASANSGSTRTGTLTIAGQVFTVTQTGSCAASISPTAQSIGASGGAGASIAVTMAAGCAWTATTSDSWITIASPAGGNGNGTVNFSVASTTGPARTGTITIAGQVFTVNQTGSCAASINPANQSIGSGGGAGSSIAVTIGAGCNWTATTSDTWITIAPPAGGSGSGTVSFSVASTAGPARTGTMTIAGQTFTVNQAGSCALAVSPAAQSMASTGGAGAPITVTSAAGCAWTATTPDSWITIAAPASGSGNGTVNFTAAATTGPARAGTILVAGRTHTVNQASGCTYTLSPTSRNFNKNAVTSSSITVTTSAVCGWTAVSNDSWITVLTGTNGAGNGTVTFSVAKNDGPDPRVGTLTIGGKTFTVNQDDH